MKYKMEPLIAFASLLVPPLLAFAEAKKPTRPNLIFILADDLGWKGVGLTERLLRDNNYSLIWFRLMTTTVLLGAFGLTKVVSTRQFLSNKSFTKDSLLLTRLNKTTPTALSSCIASALPMVHCRPALSNNRFCL